MKSALRLAPAFLLAFALCILFFSLLDLLSFWGGLLSEQPEILRGLVFSQLLQSLQEAIPVSVLLAVVYLVLHMFLKPGERFLSLAVSLAVAYGAFVLSYQGLQSITPRQRPAGQPAATPSRYLMAERMNSFQGRTVYTAALKAGELSGVLIADPADPHQVLAYFPAVKARTREGGWALTLAGEQEMSFKAEPVYTALLHDTAGRRARFIQAFFSDLQSLNRELETVYRRGAGDFHLLCFSLVFSFLAAGVLLRLTRWPLFNLLLGVLTLRLFFALLRFLKAGLAEELGKILADPVLVRNLPAVLLIALGSLLLLLDILFVPFDRWKRELRSV